MPLIIDSLHSQRRFPLTILILIALFAIGAAPVQATGIGIKTTPEEMLPFEAEATIPPVAPTLCFQTIAQKDTKLRFKIQMPPETPWLSTDFPVVEGKTLLEMETPMPDTGKWSIKPMLPIRGDYSIPASICEGSRCLRTASLRLHLNENPSKYSYFAGLALLLVIIGLTGGWIIGGKQYVHPGQVVPKKVEVLLNAAVLAAICSMLVLAVAAEMNIHQSCALGIAKEESGVKVVQDGNYRLTVAGNRDTEVGNLSTFNVEALDLKTKKPAARLPIKVNVQQLEENFSILSFTALADEAGKISWKQSFFDGAPHRVEARLDENMSPSLKSWMMVSVEPIHPTLSRRLTTFAYMIMFLLVGMLIGLIAKERAARGAV